MSKTPEIGRDNTAPFVAFGDDSKYGDVLVFAFLVIKRNDVPRMEKRLSRIKSRFGIPEQTALHCRELFHIHPREKAGLGHLTSDQARSIVGHLIHEINQLECWVRYAFSRKRPGEAFFHAGDGFPIQDDDKGIMALLAQSSLIPQVRDVGKARGPNATDCEIFVAEESTSVRFLGHERRRADHWVSGYSEVGATPGGLFRLKPNLIPIKGHPLMQVADVLAYTCSHALSQEPVSHFFAEQFSRIRLFTRSEFRSSEEGAETDPESAYQDVANRIATAMDKDGKR